MKSALFATVAAFALWGAAAPASAATYNFTFAGDEGGLDLSPYGLSGNITYDLEGNFTTTSSGAATTFDAALFFNDDSGDSYFAGNFSLDPSNPFGPGSNYFHSNTDLGFALISNSYNNISLYAGTDTAGNTIIATQYAYGDDPNYDETGFGTFTATAVSAVPLPASLPLFGMALLGLSGIGYGLKRHGKTRLTA